MPIYEYQCEKCGRVSNFLVRNLATHKTPSCPKCGHHEMTRLFSRFATSRRSGGAGSDDLDMPDLGDLDERDPRSMARVMRRMADEAGEEMPPEVDEFCRRLESGEDPKTIEKDLESKYGDVGDEDAGGSSGGTSSDDTLYEA